MEAQQVVIIGAGHAGFQCAASLRQEGFAGNIVLIGAEATLPYQRPPLSKAYLLGKASATDLLFRPAPFYDERRIQIVQVHAELIDRRQQRVVLQSGESIPYDHLVLAMGCRPRQLPVAGADLDGVFALQTLNDAAKLLPRLQPGRQAVVVGAGFIGLEFAAVARTLGLEVTVVDVADRALARAASWGSASALVEAHVQRGIRFQLGCGISGLEGMGGRVRSVRTADGRFLPADTVLVGIGVAPRVELAAQAGLEVSNGICVDARMLTSDANITAIGDVAAFPDPLSGLRIRLESVQNATRHARVAAARLAGKPMPADAVPWFWSDQGDLKLQIAGLSLPSDEHVVLAGASSFERTVLRIRGGLLAAVETINRPADHMLARRLVASRIHVDMSTVCTSGFQLKSFG